MNTPRTQGHKIKGLPKELHGLNLSFIRELVQFVGNYGKSGGTLGMRGFRLVIGGEEKPIDVISVVSPDRLILALFVKNELPPEDNVYTLGITSSDDGQEIGLIKWDSHISLDDVNNAIVQYRMPR